MPMHHFYSINLENESKKTVRSETTQEVRYAYQLQGNHKDVFKGKPSATQIEQVF